MLEKPYPKWVMLSEPEADLVKSLPSKIKRDGPVDALNLGDAQGGSAILLASGGASVFTVDNYTYAKMELSKLHAIQCGVDKLIKWIRHTTDEAFKSFISTEFDVIFVDADHSYDAVLKDTINSVRMLAPNGLIAFHDTDQPQVQQAIDDAFREFDGICHCGDPMDNHGALDNHTPVSMISFIVEEQVDRIKVYRAVG